MSNRVSLRAIEFKDLLGECKATSRGFILQDDFESIVAEDCPEVIGDMETPLIFLEKVVQYCNDNYSEVAERLLGALEIVEKGITVNGSYLDWEEIQDVISKVS